MSSTSYNIYEKNSAPVQEAYRILRTNIQFCGAERKIKTLAVTSCNPGEGKTTVSINLAVSLAKTGLKVLIVDADLRKPMIMKHLGSKNTSGLSTVITGFAAMDDVLNSTTYENLFFIPCGPTPPNPSELITSSRFTEFLKAAEERYDIIILDTPPLGNIIDSAIIASQVDGTLLVMEPKAVRFNSAQRVKEQLEKANARIIGVVLNKIKKSEYKSYFDCYSYYGVEKKVSKNWFKKNKRKEKLLL